jgi:hypothetical protein
MSIMMYKGIYPMPNSLELFIEHCKTYDSPSVLELGTKRSMESRCTMHKEWLPHASVFHGSDIEAGEDVDIIADVHRLSSVITKETYDVVITCSTFEHFKYPHLAAHEILKVLKVGGCCFVQTHFTFPLHSYPYDYFRFTKEALSGCFEGQGTEIVLADYTYPCTISSVDDGVHSSFLNVNLFVKKIAPTNNKYKYVYDTTF